MLQYLTNNFVFCALLYIINVFILLNCCLILIPKLSNHNF